MKKESATFTARLKIPVQISIPPSRTYSRSLPTSVLVARDGGIGEKDGERISLNLLKSDFAVVHSSKAPAGSEICSLDEIHVLLCVQEGHEYDLPVL